MSTIHLILSALSFLLFLAGMKRFYSAGRLNGKYSILLAGYCFLYLLWTLFYGICYYFTGRGIDYSVLYHVKYGLAGAGFGAYESLIYTSVCVLFFFTVAGGCYFFSSSKNRKTPSGFSSLIAGVFLLLAVGVHPATVDLSQLSGRGDGTSFHKYYRTPYLKASGVEPRNFVFIYAESLERTYFDEQVFPGLINHLKDLEAESIAFTGIEGFPETGWTMAGLVASQCGIPLIAPSHGNSMGGMDSFLAGATCMGDLLKAEGYHLVYMGGASLDFAGKGKFFRSHGFTEVLGRAELIPSLDDQTYLSPWGLYDDSLFDLALTKFENLSQAGKPFGLFLLTVDTHGEDHCSKSCRQIVYRNGKNGLLNAVACSDYLIAAFINRLRQSPFYNDTVIIVASDHYAMRPGRLRKSSRRSNLFFIIDPKRSSPLRIDRTGSTLDIGSTVLGNLGYTNFLGLGRNLLAGEKSVKEEVEQAGKAVDGWRKEIMKFWSFPEITESVQVNAHGHTIAIDDRLFTTPALLKYDKQFQATLWFERYNSPSHKTLLQHLTDFGADEPFLLVNECKQLPGEWTGELCEGHCLLSGKLGSETMKVRKIRDTITLKMDFLQELAAAPISDDIYENRISQIVSFQKKEQKINR